MCVKSYILELVIFQGCAVIETKHRLKAWEWAAEVEEKKSQEFGDDLIENMVKDLAF